MKTTKEMLEENVNFLIDEIRNSGLPLREYLAKNALDVIDGETLLTYGGPTISVKGGKIYGYWMGDEIVKKIQ